MPISPSQRLVLVQFALFVVLGVVAVFTPAQSLPAGKIVGAVFVIAGLILILASIAAHQLVNHAPPNISPDPNQQARLITTGALYGRMRHPIYSGVLLISFGVGLMHGGMYTWFVIAAMYIFFFFKSRYEEALLMYVYPGYKDYIKRTGRFLPRLR
ncbi:MAG TPA: isoprenylcysteine carboxylmethyltransferase family protein [Phototrophicaceae bacterium]|nr:isoprenylcysteine carboxylmethyltransferase family protein [Phototrophicaceae bacterium]